MGEDEAGRARADDHDVGVALVGFGHGRSFRHPHDRTPRRTLVDSRYEEYVMALRLLAGGAAAVVAVGSILPTIWATPDFDVPFPCGQTWIGATRTSHNPPMAIDFNRPDDEGEVVVASADGTVTFAGDTGGTYGRHVIIDHGRGSGDAVRAPVRRDRRRGSGCRRGAADRRGRRHGRVDRPAPALRAALSRPSRARRLRRSGVSDSRRPRLSPPRLLTHTFFSASRAATATGSQTDENGGA